MNSHTSARLTVQGSEFLWERIAIMGPKPAAQAAGISKRTAGKWLLKSTAIEPLACLPRPIRPRASSTDSQGRTVLNPMERLNVSFRLACGNGPMDLLTIIQARGQPCLMNGNITTIGTAHTRASAAKRRCPVSSLHARTSCNFTPRWRDKNANGPLMRAGSR